MLVGLLGHWPSFIVYNVVARKHVFGFLGLRRLLYAYVSFGSIIYCNTYVRKYQDVPWCKFARADGALNVSIIREPEGDPPGVYQAATPVTLTCTHNGSSSATYSWTCSGESNCFTQGLTQPSERRDVLCGADTGTHTCTVSDGEMSGAASTNITVTGN